MAVYDPVTPNTYVSPLSAGEEFHFVSARTIYKNYNVDPVGAQGICYQQIVVLNGETQFENKFVYFLPISGIDEIGEDIGFNPILKPGTYIVTYKLGIYIGDQNEGEIDVMHTATYTFVVVENQLPLKKWTVTDVINRLLDVCEPIRQGEKPRFRLQGLNEDGSIQAGSQAAKFDTILSPEFSFTKQTLRECLQEIGQVVHGEPRLNIKKDSAGVYYYEVSYDLYGQSERWKHANRAYVKKDVAQNVNSYASSLDTHAENLVNKHADGSGVIVDPYTGGAKSVRTEEMYVQITEQNMLIPTKYPIYTVEKLEWVRSVDGVIESVDITPWLFEKSVYGAQLSSYDDQYPKSKAYAIMYTQGEKNITQLSFKPEHPISSVFRNYAILNVLRSALNDNSLTIQEATNTSGYTEGGYPQLCFRVRYTPLYHARVGQTKTDYKDYPRPAAMIYNQQANIIESRAYGENLKGVIARLGNAEKSYTYRFSRLSQIPKPGMLFDDEYTVSAVYVELLDTVINCTVALTKNFNRISQYIGISSVKRFSQVSQTMALERNTLWKEYIVIGDQTPGDDDCYMGNVFTAVKLAVLPNTYSIISQITNVTAWGITGEGNDAGGAVNIPVVASSFGNSISFSWEYEDNYSAGAVSSYKESGSGSTAVNGYFQDNYQYTDYYGKIYYYHFDLGYEGTKLTKDNYRTVANALPGAEKLESSRGMLSTVGKAPIVLRKDNREKLQCNFQIDLVSNRKGLFIGSALAASCFAVRTPDEPDYQKRENPKLYIFPEPLNKFSDNLSGGTGYDLSLLPSVEIAQVLSIGSTAFGIGIKDGGNFPASGKAWAIVTAQTEEEPEEVETETGKISTQTVIKGGDVLIAQNMDITAGDPFPTVYFTKKREVFDKTVWKDVR